MSEQDQRQTIIKLLRPLDAMSVENTICCPGTPDVNYGGEYELTIPCSVIKDAGPKPGAKTQRGEGTIKRNVYLEGWIELKWERHWPVRGGPLRVPHYTTQQKVWARKRRHRGGQCRLLLQCSNDWILLDGAVAATLPLGDATREQLIEAAEMHWTQTPTREDLIRCLLPTAN